MSAVSVRICLAEASRPSPPNCGRLNLLRSGAMTFVSGYQCCYCGETIEMIDRNALRIDLSSLWHPKRGGTQDMFAHSSCAVEKFGGVLHPSVPFDIEAFDPND